MIVGVTGLIGAGKDAVAEHLKGKYGFVQVAFRDIIHDETVARGLEPHRHHMQAVQKEHREKHGEEYYPRQVIKRVEALKGKDVVITGIRTSHDARVLKEHFGKRMTLIVVEAKPEIRFERMRGRKRLGDPETLDQFMEQEITEAKHFDFAGAFAYADIRMDNSSELVVLHNRLEELLARTLPNA